MVTIKKSVYLWGKITNIQWSHGVVCRPWLSLRLGHDISSRRNSDDGSLHLGAISSVGSFLSLWSIFLSFLIFFRFLNVLKTKIVSGSIKISRPNDSLTRKEVNKMHTHWAFYSAVARLWNISQRLATKNSSKVRVISMP